MHMPELLNKSTLAVTARIDVESLTIALSEDPTDTAVMTVGTEQHIILVGDWMRVYTPQGGSFVAMVTSIETDYGTGMRTVNVEHVWRLLNDVMIVGDVMPGGGKKDDPTACTPTVAINKALSYQSVWALGEIDYSELMPYSFRDESVDSALDGVFETLEKHQLVLHTDTLPFTFDVKEKPQDVPCEMRLSRNINTMRVTIDRSDMWNRFYPVGYQELKLTESYVEDADSIAAWGLVEHTENIQTIEKEATLRAWAKTELARYSVPLVTVAISGLELSNSTGESIDRLRIGRLCRVPLPTYGTVITQRITKLSWSDALRQPELVTITMCNTRQNVKTLTSEVKKAKKGGGGASRGGSKGGADANTGLQSFAGELESAWTIINQTNEQIQLAAQMLTGEHTLTSNFEVKAGGVYSYVYDDMPGTIRTIQSSIEQTAGQIALKADKVTVESMGTKIEAIGSLVDASGSTVTARQINATSSVYTPYLNVSGNTITLNGSTLSVRTLPVVTSFTQASTGSPVGTTNYKASYFGSNGTRALETYF